MESQDKISFTEKVNISNNKVDEIILNKSEKVIRANDINNKSINILLAKKPTSPQGRIRAYKNKYNSPEINRLKHVNNKMILDIKHFKNKDNNKEKLLTEQPIIQNLISDLNNENYKEKLVIKEKIIDENDKGIINNIEEHKYFNEINDRKTFDNYNKDFINEQKVIQKSKSSNEFYIKNKQMFDGFEKFQNISNKENFEFINFQFPREGVIKNNSIEIIPGKFEVLNHNHNNKDLFMNNSDKQIINQENIIINNGFVNMNNNYYVNNNNIDNNLKKMNNDEYINPISNNDLDFKNNIVYNTNDYLKSKLIGLNYINKSSPNLMNINYNNNQNNEYKETKFIDKEVDMNYYQDFNPLYKSENYLQNNYINETKQSNLNLDENNYEPNYISHSPPHSLRINYPDFPEFDNKRIELNKPFYNNNNNKNENNYYSRNENILKPMSNPSYFHPNFHPNIPFQYISILKIQYPIQMMVKKSSKIELVKNKIIKYFPPKVQIEIRPCLIFMPLFKKIRKNKNKKITKEKNKVHKKVKHLRPVFKIPPFKKASLSQGKSLNFIHKYYDENFILEEDDDEEDNNNNKDLPNTERKIDEKNPSIDLEINNNNKNVINNNFENNAIKKEPINKKIIIDICNKANNNSKEKTKIELINKINKEENKSDRQLIPKKPNQIDSKKIYIKQKNINKMKIPIRNDNLQRKNKTDKIVLINIKKKKQSPIKEILNTKKNIQNIFSLNEVKQRFNSLNNSLRINSTSVSLEKSRETTLNINNKNKFPNKKENVKNKNIKIINFIPRKKLLQKSNSFKSKKVVDNISHNKYTSSLNNSYKNITIKRLGERNNSYKNINKNRIIKIDLSKL